MLRLLETKKLMRGTGYVFATADGHPVLSSSTTLNDKVEGKYKWKVGLSVTSGCLVGCAYCFTNKFEKYKRLSTAEMLTQAMYLFTNAPEQNNDFDETKIEFKEMGDPSFNAKNVGETIQTLYKADPSLLYVVSTAGIKDSPLIYYLQEARDVGASIRLQYSCHTTDDEARKELSPRIPMMELEDIAREVDAWHDGGEKVTLNFVPFAGKEMSARRVKELFAPEQIFVKMSYLDDHDIVRQSGLHEKKRNLVTDFVKDLKENGYAVAYRHLS